MLKSCFPEIADAKLENNFSLAGVLEQSNKVFVSKKMEEALHVWLLEDGENNRQQLTLKLIRNGLASQKELRLEKLDSKGLGENIPLPLDHRINPTQKILNKYLLQFKIIEERSEKLETKQNGLETKQRFKNRKLEFFELKDPKKGRRIKCENRAETMGDICFCEKN